MKLFAALGATVIGVKASNLGDWCQENTTDEMKCAAMQGNEDWNCGHNDVACYQSNWDAEMKTHNEAPAEFITEEFLSGIEDDSMMKEILAEMSQYDKIKEQNKCFKQDAEGEWYQDFSIEGCDKATRTLGNATLADVSAAGESQQQLRRFVELKEIFLNNINDL